MNNYYVGLLISYCRDIITHIFNCFVLYVKRSANVYALHLAKFSLSSVDTIRIEDYPLYITSSITFHLVAS